MFVGILLLLANASEISTEGKFIVSLTSSASENLNTVISEIEEMLQSNIRSSLSVVSKKWPLLGKFSVHTTDDDDLEIIRAHPDVRKVHSVQIFQAIEYSWGIHRIDQPALELNDPYIAAYSGSGVDAYILDTGLDTEHIEFNNTQNRSIVNFFAGYGDTSGNNDGNGHGTHCAGTVGGRTVGVSPGVNIYAGKVLSDEGFGDTEIIVDGLNAVLNRSLSSPNRALVSMSLGGPCEDGFCIDDPIIDVIDNSLSPANITTIVAAGNEACDACYGSPAGGETVITVGATDIDDNFAWFSNWGQCVDILAPGVNIVSACSSLIQDECNDDGQSLYWTISGTSMACPHVAGTIAQWMEKDATLTPFQAKEAIQCNGVNSTISEVFGDDPTKNILLQIPNTTTPSSCNLGIPCTNSCNGEGVCNRGSSGCNCYTGFTGDTCGTIDDPIITCSGSGEVYGAMYMIGNGDGWTTGSVYSLMNDRTGDVLSSSTLPCGYTLPIQFCFNASDSYSMTFTKTDTGGAWVLDPCSTNLSPVSKKREFSFTFDSSDTCFQTSKSVNNNDDDDDDSSHSVFVGLSIGIPALIILVVGMGYYYRGHIQAMRRNDNLDQGLLD